jgi:hypothetical protein
LKNPPSALRQAQGERRGLENVEEYPFVLSLSKHVDAFEATSEEFINSF